MTTGGTPKGDVRMVQGPSYLYLVAGEEPATFNGPISVEDMENCVEGYLEIIRWNGRFQRMTPIDKDDRDNWEDVP